MAFSKEEINKLENPYEQFQNGDSLAEHIAVLDSLSTKEKNTLATKIIAACPESMLRRYGYYIEALNASKLPKEESFYAVMTEAYQVRRRIFALLDPRNHNPHASLVGKEFNPGPFHRFSNLTKQLLKSNESAIAERLAICTPAEFHRQVVSNSSFAFSETELKSSVEKAFVLRHNIDKWLLGDNPEQFFTSRDFDHDTCKMFPNLFRILLKDHIELIGIKLSLIKSAETRAEIKRHLALLHTELFDDTNPFKLIADCMVVNEGAAQKKSPAQAADSSGFFATAAARQPSQDLVDAKSPAGIPEDKSDAKSDEDSEDAPFWYSLFCKRL